MQSKKLIILLLIGFVISHQAQAQSSQKPEEICYNPNAKGDTSKRSIKSAALGKIGTANIRINYYSPGVRGRTIWGGLVPYGEVWVTGAHYATNIETDRDLVVAGTRMPKGKYALFTIPDKTEWTIILNKNWNQHLTDDYTQAEDLVRIKVKPEATARLTERLQYEIDQTGERTANIIISWEKLRVKFPMEIQ